MVNIFLGLTRAAKSSSIFDLSQNLITPSGHDFEDHEFLRLHGNWDIIKEHSKIINVIQCAATGNAY